MEELGDAPLANHTWTQSILNALNAILPSASLLTEASTGNQVLQALSVLPDDEENRLLTSTVDLIQGTFTLASSTAAAPSPVAASPDPATQSFSDTVIKDLIANPSRALMLFFAFVIVIISLLLAVAMTESDIKTGKAPDTGLFQALIKALVDVISALGNSSQSH
jgi:hypothetical protein